MTPHPQQEYCIGCGNCVQEGLSHHRPRCKITRWFLDMYDVQVMIATIGCKHDTRKTPTPAAPSHSECYKKGYADAVANALSQHIDCVKCLEEDRVTMLEHDSTIRNQTIDAVLNKLRVAIGQRTWIDSDGDLHAAGALTMEEIVESLRTQSTQEQP